MKYLKQLRCVAVLAVAAPFLCAATFLQTNTSDGNARLVEFRGDPKEAGFVLIRCWPWIASRTSVGTNAIQDLVMNMNNITTVTNPQANADQYTGTFVVSGVKAVDDNEEGTDERRGSIIQTLTKVKSVSQVSDLGTPMKIADEEILNYLQFNEGTNQNVWHVYTYLNPAQYVTILGLKPTETGYRIIKKEVKEEKDKTATFTVTFETNRWVNWASSNAGKQTNIVAVGNWDAKNSVAGIQRTETKMVDGLDKVRAENARNLIGADTGKFVDGVTLQEKDNGEFGLLWNQTYARTTAQWVNTEFQAAFGDKKEIETVTWHFLTETNAQLILSDAKVNQAAMASSSYRAAPAGHYLLDIAKTPADNGSYTVTRRTWKAGYATIVWPETASEYSNNLYEVKYDSIGTNLFFRVEYYYRLTKEHSTYDAAMTTIGTNRWANAYVKAFGDSKYLSIRERYFESTGWLPINQFKVVHPKK